MQRAVTKYTITGNFSGEILLEYDALTHQLVTLSVMADLDETRLENFLNILPKTAKAAEVLDKAPLKVTKVLADVTFDMFWERYNYKVDKEVARKRWNAMSSTERIKAFNYIQKYKVSLKPGIDVMYPSTYLSKKRWND